MSRTTTAIFIAAAAGLGLLATHLALTPIDITATQPPAADDNAVGAKAPTATLGLRLDTVSTAALPQTVSRPLFWSTRRPQPPQTATPQAPTTAPSAIAAPPASLEFRLAGIFNDGSKVRRALIVWPQLPEGRWVEIGGQIEGWRLSGIEPHAIRIEAGGRSVELKLH